MKIIPSCKEFLAFFQIGIAVLAFLNYHVADLFDTPMYDIRLFEHQCINISIAFFSLFNAVGTWLWYSNLANARMIGRIHSILVYAILIALLNVTHALYAASYGPLIRGVFDHGIFDDEDHRIAMNAKLVLAISVITGLYIVVQLYYIIRRIYVMRQKR